MLLRRENIHTPGRGLHHLFVGMFAGDPNQINCAERPLAATKRRDHAWNATQGIVFQASTTQGSRLPLIREGVLSEKQNLTGNPYRKEKSTSNRSSVPKQAYSATLEHERSSNGQRPASTAQPACPPNPMSGPRPLSQSQELSGYSQQSIEARRQFRGSSDCVTPVQDQDTSSSESVFRSECTITTDSKSVTAPPIQARLKTITDIISKVPGSDRLYRIFRQIYSRYDSPNESQPSPVVEERIIDGSKDPNTQSVICSRRQMQEAQLLRHRINEGGIQNASSSSVVKHLPQPSWPRSPFFQRNEISTVWNTLESLSEPQPAAFHTSAIVNASADHTEDMNQPGDSESVSHQTTSPLGYHISPGRIRKAMQASKSSRSAYWQYTLYEGPMGEKVKVHYCRSLETAERISKLFLNESVVGFDIEWKPSATVSDGIRKNVATIQLASEERIALFHVARFTKEDTIEDLVAPSFKQIMEADSITKVGVSVKSDCTRLRKFMDINSRGLFELSHLYKLVKFASDDVKKINKKLVSLATQVEEHLTLPMYKEESVRASDWSEALNYDQIYCKAIFLFSSRRIWTDSIDAASDSYAGFQLYHTLNNKRLSLSPTPPLPAHAELNIPIRLANGQTVAEHETPVAEEPPPPEITSAPLPSPSEGLAEDLLNLQIEDESSPTEPRSKPPKSLSAHPAIVAANEWVAEYRASSVTAATTDLSYPAIPQSAPLSGSSPKTYRTRATPALLRAYFLFHHHRLSIPDIASLLRAPPLMEATVAGYILEALRLERFEMEASRVDECLGFVDEGARGRYLNVMKRATGDFGLV
ncbi:MAG: hypothetical protein Q9219_001208 [cf. Caloplaca sp. 3 TL-2023]